MKVHGGSNGRHGYECRGPVAHLSRKAETVDRYVRDVIVARLSQPDAAGLVRREPEPDKAKLGDELLVLRERERRLGTEYADGVITAATMRAGSGRLAARIREIETELARSAVRSPLDAVPLGTGQMGEVAAMLSAAARTAATPGEQLAAMAGAYVRFAAQQRPLFDTLFNSGLDKSRYPELRRAWEPVDALLAVVPEVCDGDAAAASALADAIEASAHGHVTLLINGEYGQGPDAIDAAAAKATASARALIAGRQALQSA